MSDPVCPECGASFTIDDQAEMSVTMIGGFNVAGRDLEQRMVRAIVAFCNGCEYTIVLKRITL